MKKILASVVIATLCASIAQAQNPGQPEGINPRTTSGQEVGQGRSGPQPGRMMSNSEVRRNDQRAMPGGPNNKPETGRPEDRPEMGRPMRDRKEDGDSRMERREHMMERRDERRDNRRDAKMDERRENRMERHEAHKDRMENRQEMRQERREALKAMPKEQRQEVRKEMGEENQRHRQEMQRIVPTNNTPKPSPQPAN